MTESRLIGVLNGKTETPPPIWMMRQAGRYLSEYRETRKRAGSFLDLCYDPELAVEVTLQPIERFGFDAAILFSDILVVPHALGRELHFEEGRGPVMAPIAEAEIGSLNSEGFHNHLAPVYETVSRVRKNLPPDTALIGFCGAPWTVATYMIAGESTLDQMPARRFGLQAPKAFASLLARLAECSAEYLIRQIGAGADAVQIFDTWAGVLDDDAFDAWCVRPVAEIVRRVKAVYPQVPIIGFPKGIGARYATYRQQTGVTALGLDWTVPLEGARLLQAQGPVQGNLDPLRLLAGGDALAKGIDAILDRLGEGPLVFNLGHGVMPDTPVAHVEAMVKRVRGRAG